MPDRAPDEEALLGNAPADDEPLTAEDRVAIREGLAGLGLDEAAHLALRQTHQRGADSLVRPATEPTLVMQGARGVEGVASVEARIVGDERVLFVQPEAGVLLVVRVMHRSRAY
jgi:hypothetical protein